LLIGRIFGKDLFVLRQKHPMHGSKYSLITRVTAGAARRTHYHGLQVPLSVCWPYPSTGYRSKHNQFTPPSMEAR